MRRRHSGSPLISELIVAAQRVTQRHVQRSDVITSGTDLKWVWNPETRGSVYAHYSARELPGPVDQMSVTVSYQQQAERYQRIAAAAPTMELRYFDQTPLARRERPVHEPDRAATPSDLWRRHVWRPHGESAARTSH